jgi:type IV pilus modification protein PilV
MKGFALIEILVALFIFSLGLFSIAGMQIAVLQQTEEAYWQSVAVTQLSSWSERLRANQSTVTRKKEKVAWNKLNAHLLPHGEGDYACEMKQCTAYVKWKTKQQHTLSLTNQF